MFGIVYGSDSDNEIMNRFVDEYEGWCNEGKNPDVACLCSNCGAVSSIKELLNGCKNCGTRFIMDDLFPKVTNFVLCKNLFDCGKVNEKGACSAQNYDFQR